MKTLLAAAILALSSFAFAENDHAANTLVRFKATTAIKAWLRDHDADVTGVNIPRGEVEALLTQAELHELESLKTPFEYQVPKSLLRGPDPEYFNPEEIEARLKAYAAKYPDLAQLRQAGTSLEGRPIWSIKISDGVATHDSSEPALFFNGMHHAREVMSPEVAMDIVDYLLSNYNSDNKVRDWVDNNEIYVIPMFNVDGNNKMWTKDSMWRKNTRDGHGVDINRNYPYAWNSCKGSSGFSWAQDYRGPSAASEPETKVMMKFVSEIRPVFSISYHSYSELVIYPYGCSPKRAETASVVEPLGKAMAAALGYTPGTSWETLYSVDGGDIDWLYNAMQVIPYVIEVNSSSAGFHPDYAKWRNKTVELNRKGWQMLLDRAHGSGVRGLISATNESNLMVDVMDASGKLYQSYRVNPDGSYHLVLNPGQYTLKFKSDRTMLGTQAVMVADKLVRMDKRF